MHSHANPTAAKRLILVADDQEEIRTFVGRNLSEAGFAVLEAEGGNETLDLVRQYTPSLIILDLVMPDLNGNEVIRSLRLDQKTASIPVIVLTACKDEIDRVLAFELGADDYVTKPFSPRELVLRIKSILSKSAPVSKPTVHDIGQLKLDTERHELSVRGKLVDITAMEFKLLSVLALRAGRVFSRDELITSVWGFETDIDSRTVDTHLRRLRDKLGPASSQIQTVRGVGYRLIDK